MAFRPRIHDGAGPPWRQVRDAVMTAVERGSLVPGDRLPPVRDLAADLELAPNTVARAYRELEREGWLEGRGRAGTFVADEPPTGSGTRAQLATAAERYLRRAAQLGFDAADARSMLDRVRTTP